eukprot:5350080-Pyramimonas_sp.AAC.1
MSSMLTWKTPTCWLTGLSGICRCRLTPYACPLLRKPTFFASSSPRTCGKEPVDCISLGHFVKYATAVGNGCINSHRTKTFRRRETVSSTTESRVSAANFLKTKPTRAPTTFWMRAMPPGTDAFPERCMPFSGPARLVRVPCPLLP